MSKKAPKNTEILSRLGIYGWEKITPQVIAALMLGEPFALISEPGTGKTYLGQIIGEALDLKFGYYDVSKSEFSDVIGFPSPDAYKEGKIEPIPTELTIEDKEVIVVDELSRINRSMSNAWLEILGSRMILGRPLPLRVVMGAMNPIHHQGTKPLDEAFADRFIAFIPTPTFSEMDTATRKEIIGAETGLDAPSAKFWAGETERDYRARYVTSTPEFRAAAEELQRIVKEAAQSYMAFTNHPLGQRITDYVDLFASALSKENGIALEGRRLKMIKRFIESVITTYAVMQETTVEKIKEEEMIELVGACVAMSMPNQVTGKGELSAQKIKLAHDEAASALKGDLSEYLLYNTKSLAEKVSLVLTNKYDPTMVQKIVAELALDESTEADMLCLTLTSLMQHRCFLDYMPLDVVQKLVGRISQVQLASQTGLGYSPLGNYEKMIRESEELNKLTQRVADKPVENMLLAYAYGKLGTEVRAGMGMGTPEAPDDQLERSVGTVIRLYDEAMKDLNRVRRVLRPVKERYALADNAVESE